MSTAVTPASLMGHSTGDERYCVNHLGKRDGPSILIRNGEIVQIGRYHNDAKHGAWMDFSPTGVMREVRHFEGGTEVGTNLRLFDTGILYEARPANENSGPSCSFETDASRVSAGFLDRGKFIGEWCLVIKAEAQALRYRSDGSSTDLVSIEIPGG